MVFSFFLQMVNLEQYLKKSCLILINAYFVLTHWVMSGGPSICLAKSIQHMKVQMSSFQKIIVSIIFGAIISEKFNYVSSRRLDIQYTLRTQLWNFEKMSTTFQIIDFCFQDIEARYLQSFVKMCTSSRKSMESRFLHSKDTQWVGFLQKSC